MRRRSAMAVRGPRRPPVQWWRVEPRLEGKGSAPAPWRQRPKNPLRRRGLVPSAALAATGPTPGRRRRAPEPLLWKRWGRAAEQAERRSPCGRSPLASQSLLGMGLTEPPSIRPRKTGMMWRRSVQFSTHSPTPSRCPQLAQSSCPGTGRLAVHGRSLAGLAAAAAAGRHSPLAGSASCAATVATGQGAAPLPARRLAW